MKACPACAEQIQDAASKCRFCGTDIAAAEAAQAEAEVSGAMGRGIGILLGIIGAGIFGFLGYQAVLGGEMNAAMVAGGFAAAFLVLAPLASRMGDAFRQYAMPDVVFANGAADLASKKLFWEFGPTAIAPVLVFAGMFLLLLEIVPQQAFEKASTQAATEKAAPAADAQAEQAAAINRPSQPEPSAEQVAARQAALDQGRPVAAPVATPAVVEEKPAAEPVAVVAPAAVTAPVEKVVIEASFDCRKAASSIEKLICSSPETAAADKRLAGAYSEARAKASDANALKTDQKVWIAERNACADAGCLLRVTEERIQKLSAM